MIFIFCYKRTDVLFGLFSVVSKIQMLIGAIDSSSLHLTTEIFCSFQLNKEVLLTRVIIPLSYLEKIDEIGWETILRRLGIKKKNTGSDIYNKRYKANCVFHNEKTASLSFFQGSESFFFCFACQTAGSKFKFVSMVFAKNRTHAKGRTMAYRWFKKCFNIPLPWENR